MTCTTCKHSIPSQAYPQVFCWFISKYMDSHDHCVRWEGK